MRKYVFILVLVVCLFLRVHETRAQAVAATSTNRLCWFEVNDSTLQGFKLIRGTVTGVSLTTPGAVITDVGLALSPTTVGITLTVPTDSTGYCSQTFSQLGVPNGNYFYNIVAYNDVGNSGLNGEVQISPLVVTAPVAAGGLSVK